MDSESINKGDTPETEGLFERAMTLLTLGELDQTLAVYERFCRLSQTTLARFAEKHK